MREIKFRGWDATGQKGWVYGDLKHAKGISKDAREDLYDRVMVGGYEVVPESVGQFTGLYDKNGKEIYEGDIIDNSWCFSGNGVVCFGEYQHLNAQKSYKNGDYGFFVKHNVNNDIRRHDILYFTDNCEVIDTIYEHNKK